MIFLTSLVFSVLLFGCGGQLALLALAERLPGYGMPLWLMVGILDVALYAIILATLNLAFFKFRYFGLDKDEVVEKLGRFTDVQSCRWINSIGLIAIVAGAGVLFFTARLPYHFWFLFGAIFLGLMNLVGRTNLLPLPSILPRERFSMPEDEESDRDAPAPDEHGKRIEFKWKSSHGDDYREVHREFLIRHDDYGEAQAIDRFSKGALENYGRYVSDGFCYSLQRVAAYFREASQMEDQSPIQETMDVVNFSRSIVYVSDEEQRGVPDYANFPVETLYDEGGDCEDHAILAATILHHLGHHVALFWIKTGDDTGHIALGCRTPGGSSEAFTCTAANGEVYAYVETVPTDANNAIGDIPEEFLERLQESRIILIE